MKFSSISIMCGKAERQIIAECRLDGCGGGQEAK